MATQHGNQLQNRTERIISRPCPLALLDFTPKTFFNKNVLHEIAVGCLYRGAGGGIRVGDCAVPPLCSSLPLQHAFVRFVEFIISADSMATMATMPPASDVDDVLRHFSAGLQYASLHRRLAVLQALNDWVCCGHSTDTISKPQTRVLVRLMLTSLCSPQYMERSWIQNLYNAIASATKSELCPMFTPICVVNLAGE